MGQDDSACLNDYEIEYFKKLFIGKDIFLDGKKVGFVGYCGRKSNKLEYFKEVKKVHKEHNVVSTDLYLLSSEQKYLSGGYDVIIVYWCKKILRAERLLEIISK